MKEERFEARNKFVEALLLLKKIKGTPSGYGAPIDNTGQEALYNKQFIDKGTNVTKNILPITNELWKMASEDFSKSGQFIIKNGKIYNSIRN